MLLRNLLRWLPGSPSRRALELFDRGDFAAAAAAFDALLGDTADAGGNLGRYASEAHLEVGRRRAAAGDAAGAIADFERAAALRPHWADVQMQLGRLYESSDRPDAARAAYERALAVNPRYFEARLALARLLVHLGQGGAAMRHLQEAASGAPSAAADALSEIASSLSRQESPTARLDALLDTLLPTPAVGERIAAVQQFLRAGNYAAAIAALQELLRLHPDFPDLHHLLGVAYDAEQMIDDAIEEFEQALRLNAAYVEARINLALALCRRGRDAEAERHLRRVIQQEPQHELARSLLASIEARHSVR